MKQENIGSFSFLDVKISRKNGKFVTRVTENQHLLKFLRVLKVSSQSIKRGDVLTYCLIGVLAYAVILSFEIDHLTTIFMKNHYCQNSIKSCIKSFINKLYLPKVTV